MTATTGAATGGGAAWIVGLDFGGTKAAVAVGHPDGTVAAESRLPVAAYGDAHAVVAAALAEAGRLLARLGVTEPAAVGVSSMGITGPTAVLLAPNVPGWSRLRLAELVGAAFPRAAVAIWNDVKAALLAEMRWGALRGPGGVAYINLGTGVALAFGRDGAVWAGDHGAAGEVAYLWEAGEPGAAAGRAPFEERLGGGALDRAADAAWGGSAGVAAAFARWDRDPAVADWLTARLAALARGLGGALLVVDVGRVAIGGGMAVQFDRLAPIFRREWEEHLPFPPDILPAAFVGRAGVMGALAVGAEVLP